MVGTPLFASNGDLPGPATLVAMMIVVILIVLLSLVMLMVKYYKRCPSNRIMVIYGNTGPRQAFECISGGARLVLPLIQDYAWLSLEPMQIEVPLRAVLSADKMRINVRSAFTVAIGTSPELMQNAASRLLGLSLREIEKLASEIIFGQVRQAIGTLRIEEVIDDRDSFLSRIQASLEPPLRKTGLVVINVSIGEITDESGYIKAVEQKALPRLVARLMKEGKLSESDRQEIRSLLDTSG